jgi:hypothetical protein
MPIAAFSPLSSRKTLRLSYELNSAAGLAGRLCFNRHILRLLDLENRLDEVPS